MPMRSSLLRARHDKRRKSATPEVGYGNLLQVHGSGAMRRSSFTSLTDSLLQTPQDQQVIYRSKSSTVISERRSSYSPGLLGPGSDLNGSSGRRSSFALSDEPTLYVPDRKQMCIDENEVYRIKKLNVAAVFFAISSAVIGVAVFAYYLKAYT